MLVVYPEGCGPEAIGHDGVNGDVLPDGADGSSWVSRAGRITGFGTHPGGGYVLYTAQGSCHYVQYVTGPEFTAEVPAAVENCE